MDEQTQQDQIQQDTPAEAEQADQATASDSGEAQTSAEGDAATAGDTAAGDQEVAATIEAILFASDTPLPASRIAQVAELPSQRTVKQAIELLNQRYENVGCAFRVASVAGGYQLMTQPQYADVLSRLHKSRNDGKLSQAAMETLAIIAYRQPIMRADVEAIRGVASGEVLRGLMDKQLVKIVGRAEVIGRPMLYGTTRRFLETFGLNTLADLPRAEELRQAAQASGAADVKPEPQPQPGDDGSAA